LKQNVSSYRKRKQTGKADELLKQKLRKMKTLINRTFTENEREDIIGMAESFVEDNGGSFFKYLKAALIEKMNEKGLRNDKKAYTVKDAMYQSFSDSQDNYKRTGKYL
jgi:hypothetical protein